MSDLENPQNNNRSSLDRAAISALIETDVLRIKTEYETTDNSWISCFESSLDSMELIFKSLGKQMDPLDFQKVLEKFSLLKKKIHKYIYEDHYSTFKYEEVGYELGKIVFNENRSPEVPEEIQKELIEELRALVKSA